MKFKLENLFDFRQLIKHLSSGLQRLTLEDNFEGTRISVQFEGNGEVSVRNPLNFVPSSYIIISKSGIGTIYKSNTWTTDFVYFTNEGAGTYEAIIYLMR